MSDGAMETVECLWVDIWCMLDLVVGLCHKTAEMHFPGMGCSTSEMMLWLTEMECVKIRTHYKAEQAAARSHGCAEVGRVDCDARRGLRIPSSLRFVAIQAIDIFIRGCYL